MSNMTIIGTGLSGMVGTRFQELYGDRYIFSNLDLTTGVDITDRNQVERAIAESNAQVVVHLAAFTNVSAAHLEEGNTEGTCYRVNVGGTENIALAAAKHDKYLIHISTDFVFDGTKQDPYTEEDTPNPIEWYGQTKLWAEEAVVKAGGKHVILRLAYPYQAKPMRPDFLETIRQKLTDNTLPPAFTNHSITPTFVDDLVAVFDYSITNQPTGLYHALGSSWHTDYEIALLVKELFHLPGDVKEGDVDAYIKTVNRPYQKTMKVSNQKLRRDFKLEMKTLPQGLEEIVRQLLPA
jgi:dTDP-4-dehydrorhamnose reductase